MSNKVKLTARALFQRVARKVAQEGKTFHAMRRGTPYGDKVGRYFSVNENNNICGPAGDDLEAIAREVEVLKPWEALGED